MCKGSTAAPEADPSRDKYLLADLMKLLKTDQIATSRRFTAQSEASFRCSSLSAKVSLVLPCAAEELFPEMAELSVLQAREESIVIQASVKAILRRTQHRPRKDGRTRCKNNLWLWGWGGHWRCGRYQCSGRRRWWRWRSTGYSSGCGRNQ